MEFVRDDYGWREGRVEGTYKGYKSVECIMAGRARLHEVPQARLRARHGPRERRRAGRPADARGGVRARQAARLRAARRPSTTTSRSRADSEDEFNATMREHRNGLGVDALSDEAFARALEERRAARGGLDAAA